MKRVYYAHSMHLYGKPQEYRDINTLFDLGFEVVNPSDQLHKDKCDEIRQEYPDDYDKGSEEIMKYFMEVVDSCDGVAFRAHIDGKIPSGVGKEVKRAIETHKPIIELPTLYNSKFMEKGETRQYLNYLGER